MFEKLAADVQARWLKSTGKKVFYLTGTDEHGIKTLIEAQKLRITPKEFVDRMSSQFKLAWQDLNIQFDRFIRTTDPDHEEVAKKIIELVWEAGDIYKGKYSGYYCVGCEKFLTEDELVNGKCPYHNIEPEYTEEDCYFFKLSKYRDQLLEFYKSNPNFILPKKRTAEIINRIKDGLQDIAITRPKKRAWGIEFPFNKDHVIYVWFDALPNYLTGAGWPKKGWNKIWPADYHHIGKDILWFHAVIWPAILMSAKLPLPKHLAVHGFLTLNGKRLSKSTGNIINPQILAQKYGADSVRYYVMRTLPYFEDGDFSEKELVERHNAELVNEIGNLVARVGALAEKINTIPKPEFDEACLSLYRFAVETKNKIDAHLSKLAFHNALDAIINFVKECNRFIDKYKPWELKGKQKQNIIAILANAIWWLSAFIWPFMPSTADRIAAKFGKARAPMISELEWGKLTGKMIKGEPLFVKLSTEQPFESLFDFRVAKIANIEDIKGADKLYLCTLDVGELGARQVVAGLKEFFKKQDLLNRKVIYLANLQPTKIRGITSFGMILVGQKENELDLLDSNLNPGERLCFEGLENYQPAIRVKYDQFKKLNLRIEHGNIKSGNLTLKGVKSKFDKGLVL